MNSLLRAALRPLYNRIRPFLPQKIGVYYSVAARDAGILDHRDVQHDRKDELLGELRRRTKPGDHVIILGGGRGMAAVVAARRVLPDGRVTVYEAAAEQCERTRETARLNQVADYVNVEQAIVGGDVEVWGDETDATHLSASDLPDADVWVVDIEGGERSLFRDADHEAVAWPDTMLIETHRANDAPPSTVKRALPACGKIVRQHRIDPPLPWSDRNGLSADDVVLVWTQTAADPKPARVAEAPPDREDDTDERSETVA
jgi:hypothetical protein